MKKQSVYFQHQSTIKKEKPQKDPLEKLGEECDVTKEEVLQIKQNFRRYDIKQNNTIEWYEVDDIYRDIGVEITDSFRNFIKKKINEMDIKAVSLQETIKIYGSLKNFMQEEEDELSQLDTINAFVALGGNLDKTGGVNTKTIIDIIRKEFLLDFDIESYLEKQGLADLEILQYEDFQKLFENEDAKEILSSYSREQRNKQLLGTHGKLSKDDEFNVDYRDFELWEKRQSQNTNTNSNNIIQQEQQV